jgi:arylsulfatase A-like enzyme
MTRITTRTAWVLFATFLAAQMTAAAHGADTPTKPNVLFLAIDDQNDWIGHLGGHPMAKTPHLDKLAARGSTFLKAHCNAPL